MFPYRATSSGEDSPKPGSTLVCIKNTHQKFDNDAPSAL